MKTDDYYSQADFGYPQSALVNPIQMVYIFAIPYIWDQIKWQLIISTSIYAVLTVIGFLLFMPLDLLTTAIYLQYLVLVF